MHRNYEVTAIPLNADGQAKHQEINEAFDGLLQRLHQICGMPRTGSTREFSVVNSKLEEAHSFAIKCLQCDPMNHDRTGHGQEGSGTPEDSTA
jgi:hypothetical protein